MIKNKINFFSKLNLFFKRHKVLNVLKYLYFYFDRFICIFIKKNSEIYQKKQVLILARLALGDAINFLSVCDIYRKLYSKNKYEITLLTTPGLEALFKKETKFDYVYSKDFESIIVNLKKRIDLFKFVNSKHYDILIDIMGPMGCSPNLYISAASKADEKVTLSNKAFSLVPNSLIKKTYTTIYEVNNKRLANIDYFNKLVNLLNGNNGKYEIKFHKFKNQKINIDLPKNYYIVFPSASSDVKKWPLERYAKIIKRIYKKTKLPVLFCGTKIDLKDIKTLISHIDVPYINIVGKTNIFEYIEVIKKAKFIVTNDTSSYHIGINEEIPTAIITGGYTYYGFVKYDFYNNKYGKPYIIVSKKDCFECHSNCPYIGNKNIWPCLDEITVEYAWKIINKMIDDVGDYE